MISYAAPVQRQAASDFIVKFLKYPSETASPDQTPPRIARGLVRPVGNGRFYALGSSVRRVAGARTRAASARTLFLSTS